MHELWKDFRYGGRLLLKNPGVTLVAVLALALGIGANTAIFSVVNTVLLRPLPFPHADRLVTMRIDNLRYNVRNALACYPDIADWRQQSRSFDSLQAFSPGSVNLISRGEPERVSLWKVNAGLFPMLGAHMALGRGFLPAEDQPGAGRVVILSHSLWQRRFGGDAAMIGKPVVIDGNPYTVVGILPASFKLEEKGADLYAPIALGGAHARGDEWRFAAYARLKPGVSLARAQAELAAIQQRLEQHYRRPLSFYPHIWGMREFMVRDVRLSLIVLLGAVALVLLIACANVANLLLARAGVRQKEMAIRAALGAARGRVVRQLLTESVLLALVGGACGLLLAWWGIGALSALGSERLPMLKQSRLDLPVLAFTMLASLLTGLIFGTAPALAVARTNVHETLQAGGRGSAEGRGGNRLRGLLVVCEVALALLLMIGASLMMRSLLKLHGVNPGFRPPGVLTASIDLPASKYSKPEQQIAFFSQLEERLGAMPGVNAAGLTSVLPLTGNNQGMVMVIEGRPVSGPADAPILYYRMVDGRYFQAMRIPLRKGRLFTAQDKQGAPRVLIVNETMARRFWPNQDPIGKRVGTGAPQDWMLVVGVVGDVRHMSLAQEPDAEIFLPLAQNPRPDMKLVVRTASDPLRFAPALRQAVMEVDRDQPVSLVASMEQNLSDSIATKRFAATLLTIFAAVALLLAVVGIYGVIAYSVTRRRQEIGVRMALGARGGDVLRMVVGQGTLLALIGVIIGLAAAFPLTRVIASLLYGVKAADPAVYSGVALLLIAVAALASYLPARRAAKVDPVVALRYE
jgi:putative ABC transport system permease protein